MVDSISASLTDKRSKVLPDNRTSQLVVVATESEQEAVDYAHQRTRQAHPAGVD